jgi:predicted RNA-binding protein with EMAP domain
MKTIKIHGKAIINGHGEHTYANAKPVICIETGEVFTSVLDASDYAGVANPSMVSHLKGRSRSCNGKHYCYLSSATESLNSIVTRLREVSVMEAKAKMWDALMAEQEAERKAEERRLANIAKLEAKEASLNDKYMKRYEEAIALFNELAEVRRELRDIKGEEEMEEIA